MSISVLISVLHTPAGLIRVVPKNVSAIVIDCISEGTDSRNWQLHMSTGDEDIYRKMRKKTADRFWTLKFLHKEIDLSSDANFARGLLLKGIV